jgi:putative phosphoesterase
MLANSKRTLGIIGDIHCQDKHLKCAIEYLQGNGPTAIYCTGDIVDGQGDVHKCIEYLRAANVKLVLGNHDDWLLQNVARDLPEATQRNELSDDEIEYLEELPKTIEIETLKSHALLCHGFGENYMSKINPDDYGYAIESNIDLQKLIENGRYKLVINGHSHRKMIRNIQGLTVINAGSLIAEEGPSFMMIDLDEELVTQWLLEKNGKVLREGARKI